MRRFIVRDARGRRRLCAITAEALDLLARQTRSSPITHARTFAAQRPWIEALARCELSDGGRTVLSAAHVRFQLACDEAAGLPAVLCV